MIVVSKERQNKVFLAILTEDIHLLPGHVKYVLSLPDLSHIH